MANDQNNQSGNANQGEQQSGSQSKVNNPSEQTTTHVDKTTTKNPGANQPKPQSQK